VFCILAQFLSYVKENNGMRASESIIRNYQLALNYIKESTEKGLTIFIADEDLLYLKLFKNIFPEKSKFEVHSFVDGEECLYYAMFKPDLVILVNNEDNKFTFEKGLEAVAQEVEGKMPDTMVVLISLDDKLAFAEGLIDQKVMDYDLSRNDECSICSLVF